jgi:hypothetical protein
MDIHPSGGTVAVRAGRSGPPSGDETVGLGDFPELGSLGCTQGRVLLPANRALYPHLRRSIAR